MWFTANEDVTLTIEFKVNGDYVIPTEATATVRDAEGAPISGLEDISLAVGSTNAPLVIPAVHNMVTPGNSFETRFVTVGFVHNTRHWRISKSYRISPLLLMTTGPDDVRRELGLDGSELPDEDIDLTSAYLRLEDELGSIFTEALKSGNSKAISANRAISLRAALDIVDSLPFRVAVKMKAEDSSIDRMKEFDVAMIRLRLGQRLSEMTDHLENFTDTGRTSFVVGTPTDAITGA